MATPQRVLLVACSAFALLACEDHGPRPEREVARLCVVTDRFGAPFALGDLAEAETLGNTVTARIAGEAVTDPGAPPWSCSFDPARTLAFDDGGGHRWWIGVSVLRPDGTDATPPIAAPAGAVTATWADRYQFAIDTGFALVDEDGLVFALYQGDLVIDPEDAGGLVVAGGPRVGPTYRDTCGASRERSLVFSGESSVALRPGETGEVTLGGASVAARNLSSFVVIGTQCPDAAGWLEAMAWRPGSG